MDTNTPHLLIAAGCCALNVCSSLGVTTATNGVFLVVADVEINTKGGKRGSQGRDSTWADTGDGVLDVVDLDNTGEATLEVLGVEGLAGLGRSGGLRAVGGDAVVDKGEARVGLEVVGFLEEIDNLGRLQLPADSLGLLLHDLAEFDLQGAREIQLQAAQDNPGGATLATLGVDANDCLVGTADILGVQGQVRNDPLSFLVDTPTIFAQLETLLDCILVTEFQKKLAKIPRYIGEKERKQTFQRMHKPRADLHMAHAR